MKMAKDGENLAHESTSMTSLRTGGGGVSGMAHTLAGRDTITVRVSRRGFWPVLDTVTANGRDHALARQEAATR